MVFSETPNRWAISRIGSLPAATSEAAVSVDGFHCQDRLDSSGGESTLVSALASPAAAATGEPRSASAGAAEAPRARRVGEFSAPMELKARDASSSEVRK
jgi:hypothetical protein